jgi:membrane protease YdiL (CAAX protease family)
VVASPAVLSRVKQAWLVVEYAVLFFGLAGVYALIGHPGSPVPLLVLGAIGAVLYLRSRPDFDRRAFFRAEAIRGQLRSIVLLWAIAAVVILVALVILSPGQLFELPRRNPLLWAVVMILYPLASVYPQELIFRAFLFHRYRPVFGSTNGVVAASAAAFGFVHIIYGQWLSVVLTVIAGWLFGQRYRLTNSLATVWLEHAMYGLLAFTVGLGSFFFNGNR